MLPNPEGGSSGKVGVTTGGWANIKHPVLASLEALNVDPNS